MIQMHFLELNVSVKLHTIVCALVCTFLPDVVAPVAGCCSSLTISCVACETSLLWVQCSIPGTARGVLQLWSFSAGELFKKKHVDFSPKVFHFKGFFKRCSFSHSGGIWHDKDLLQQGRQPDIRAIAAHWVEDCVWTFIAAFCIRIFLCIVLLWHCLRTEQSLRAVMVRCVCGIYMAAACQGLVMPKVTEGKMPLSNLVNGFR